MHVLARTETIATAAQDWLARLETALVDRNGALLASLFVADSYWRDVLAFTWRIQTTAGGTAVASDLGTHAARARPHAFELAPGRAPPRRVTRAGTQAIEAIFRFETAQSRGNGVVRLVSDAADGDAPKAWTLLTALDEIKGHEERLGRARPSGESYARDFRGPNWLDARKATAAYTERDPVVLVVGAGQAGLSIAARLGQLQIDTLVVDRGRRLGAN